MKVEIAKDGTFTVSREATIVILQQTLVNFILEKKRSNGTWQPIAGELDYDSTSLTLEKGTYKIVPTNTSCSNVDFMKMFQVEVSSSAKGNTVSGLIPVPARMVHYVLEGEHYHREGWATTYYNPTTNELVTAIYDERGALVVGGKVVHEGYCHQGCI